MLQRFLKPIDEPFSFSFLLVFSFQPAFLGVPHQDGVGIGRVNDMIPWVNWLRVVDTWFLKQAREDGQVYRGAMLFT
jgi:hypothetical protein